MVEVNLNETQMNILREMVPLYGDTVPEVIKTIIIMFLHEHIENVEQLLCWSEIEDQNQQEGPVRTIFPSTR
ncbi:MAG: hypothetical protein MUO73_09755 [Thermoplasmata archaeon]|nr:hypothetical protein [Thermoplasmata archaeon]